LVVHVNDSTRPDVRHLATVQRFDFTKLARLNQIASILSEEDGDTVVGIFGSTDVVARLLESAGTAPRVDVVSPKVHTLARGVAVEVLGQVETDVGIVIGGVSNGNGPVILLLDVGLHVTDGSLNISGSGGVVGLVGDLISSEEPENVAVALEGVNHGRVASVNGVIPLRRVTVDRRLRLGKIADDIDACILQQLHARGVVRFRVDGVHTDGVGPQLLEQRNIPLTSSFVGEGVFVERRRIGALLLVGNTLHVELGSISFVEELCASQTENQCSWRQSSVRD